MSKGHKCIYCGGRNAEAIRIMVLHCPDCGKEFHELKAVLIRQLRVHAPHLDQDFWSMVNQIVGVENRRRAEDLPFMPMLDKGGAIYLEVKELVFHYYGGDNTGEADARFSFDPGAFLAEYPRSLLLSKGEYVDPFDMIVIRSEFHETRPQAAFCLGGEVFERVLFQDLVKFRDCIQAKALAVISS